MSAFYENELGRVYVSQSIITQVILPEVIASKSFSPIGLHSEMNLQEFPLPKGLQKSVKLTELDGGGVEAKVSVSAKYGTSIVDEATKLRKKIRQAVQSQTGLDLAEIYISVEHVHNEEELVKPTKEETKEEEKVEA